MKGKSKKTPLAMLPQAGIIHGAEAAAYGNQKHEPYDWRNGEVSLMEYISAIMRHCACIIDGEDAAPDSQVEHLGHIIADASIVLDAKEVGVLKDDRPPKGEAAYTLERIKGNKGVDDVLLARMGRTKEAVS